MNKFTIVFCLVALAAVALAAEEQGPAASEYDVYSSNGDNVEDAARPKRTLLLKKKLLLGKALILKKGLALKGGLALAGAGAYYGGGYGGGYGDGYGRSYGYAPTVHYSYAPAPIHKTIYVSSGYHGGDYGYDNHGWNSGFSGYSGGHYDDDHHDDYYHGGYSHGW